MSHKTLSLSDDDSASVVGLSPEFMPLSLYVHIPWCVKKCPYCDFNSHPQRGVLPEVAYVDALLADLAADRAYWLGRPFRSIFIGGGTPSLFSPNEIGRLLSGVDALNPLPADCEITLEANPGTVDAGHFQGFWGAGVNRLSLGVQSFSDQQLQRLGRIHDARAACLAIESLVAAGFRRWNIDLMYALPEQAVAGALSDLEVALSFSPPHISWYQLTLEPNTLFYQRPPPVPDDDLTADIAVAGLSMLADAGYARYEVSAYEAAGGPCQHNVNYWQFGDYIGIGAGAHGKVTGIGEVLRVAKHRHPRAYLSAVDYVQACDVVAADELPMEFLMNALRLLGGFSVADFEARTGHAFAVVADQVAVLVDEGLLGCGGGRVWPTIEGMRFLDSVLVRLSP